MPAFQDSPLMASGDASGLISPPAWFDSRISDLIHIAVGALLLLLQLDLAAVRPSLRDSWQDPPMRKPPHTAWVGGGFGACVSGQVYLVLGLFPLG